MKLVCNFLYRELFILMVPLIIVQCGNICDTRQKREKMFPEAASHLSATF